MINIQHQDSKFLVLNNNGHVALITGQEGNVTSAPDSATHTWHDTREEAVASAQAIDPEWVDPEELLNLPE